MTSTFLTRSALLRLVVEEDGTSMTDSRSMYGWTAVFAITAYYVYGHRVPELITYLDKLLPPANGYHMP